MTDPLDISRRDGCGPIFWTIMLAVIGGLLVLCWLAGAAQAHPVTNAAGEPTGEVYPLGCCNSAATSPTGDCAPIDDMYVREVKGGWQISVPVGGHPKLKTKGVEWFVPYDKARKPMDNQYHLCVSTDGASKYCFFPKPGTS